MFNKVHESKKEQKFDKVERKINNQTTYQHLPKQHDQIYDVRFPIPNSTSNETPIIAIDCEMVQCEDKMGQPIQKLARLSVVNYYGHKLIDNYYRVQNMPQIFIQKPNMRVSNFLTRVSGITPGHLKTAPVYNEEEQEKIRKLFKGKIKLKKNFEDKTIVGHSLKHDFGALNIDQSKFVTRDIGIVNSLKEDGRIQGLKKMVSKYLAQAIQEGSHCSIIDARASLFIFRKFQDQISNEYRTHQYKNVKKRMYEDLKNMNRKKKQPNN